jgi:hypothetical protein
LDAFTNLELIAHAHPDIDKAKEIIKTQLLTHDFIPSCCEVLVSKYLTLTKEDINKWEDEPETFVAEEEADQWEFNLRVRASV